MNAAALSMPFNGAMLTNENVLASLDTLTDWRARVLSILEGMPSQLALQHFFL